MAKKNAEKQNDQKTKWDLYVYCKGKENNDLHSPSNIQIRKERITHKNFRWGTVFFWNILTYFTGRVYVAYCDGKMVHYSYLFRTKYKFCFLKKNDIEIGPCWTDSRYRGQNIYPTVLKTVVKNELHNDAKAYVFIEKRNVASINGAGKAGFERTGDVIVRDGLKRYVIEKP